MAYKRRRIETETPLLQTSSPPWSFETQSISRTRSVHLSASSSSPRLPTLPQQRTEVPRVLISNGCAEFRTYDQARTGRNDYVETDVEISRREDLDAMNEIIMAIDMKERGTIGCAYYVAREEKICLMEDIKMAGLETIETVKLQAQPTTILIRTRSDEKLEEYLSREARCIDRGDEASKLLID